MLCRIWQLYNRPRPPIVYIGNEKRASGSERTRFRSDSRQCGSYDLYSCKFRVARDPPGIGRYWAEFGNGREQAECVVMISDLTPVYALPNRTRGRCEELSWTRRMFESGSSPPDGTRRCVGSCKHRSGCSSSAGPSGHLRRPNPAGDFNPSTECVAGAEILDWFTHPCCQE